MALRRLELRGQLHRRLLGVGVGGRVGLAWRVRARHVGRSCLLQLVLLVLLRYGAELLLTLVCRSILTVPERCVVRWCRVGRLLGVAWRGAVRL